MRKGLKENIEQTILYSAENLQKLHSEGYNYVMVRGLTIDRHYEYVEPYYILLIPCKTLPTDKAAMEIYEPIDSELLLSWLSASNEYPTIVLLAASK